MKYIKQGHFLIVKFFYCEAFIHGVAYMPFTSFLYTVGGIEQFDKPVECQT